MPVSAHKCRLLSFWSFLFLFYNAGFEALKCRFCLLKCWFWGLKCRFCWDRQKIKISRKASPSCALNNTNHYFYAGRQAFDQKGMPCTTKDGPYVRGRNPTRNPEIPKKTPRLHELFRKVRVNFSLLTCETSQKPTRNCSEKLVQMNSFIWGGFFGLIFLLWNMWCWGYAVARASLCHVSLLAQARKPVKVSTATTALDESQSQVDAYRVIRLRWH